MGASRTHGANPASTVADYFKVGRVRPDESLVLAIVEVLSGDAGYTGRWRQAFQAVRQASHEAVARVAGEGEPRDGVCAALLRRGQGPVPHPLP